MNTCFCCGEIIPEGRQVCPKCENEGQEWERCPVCREEPVVWKQQKDRYICECPNERAHGFAFGKTPTEAVINWNKMIRMW